MGAAPIMIVRGGDTRNNGANASAETRNLAEEHVRYGLTRPEQLTCRDARSGMREKKDWIGRKKTVEMTPED